MSEGSPLNVSGTYYEGQEGQWNEGWYIGTSNSPGSTKLGELDFYIHPGQCNVTFSGTTDTLSYDNWENYYGYWFFDGTDVTDADAEADVILPSAYCHVYNYSVPSYSPSSPNRWQVVTEGYYGVSVADQGNTVGGFGTPPPLGDQAGSYSASVTYYAEDDTAYSSTQGSNSESFNLAVYNVCYEDSTEVPCGF